MPKQNYKIQSRDATVATGRISEIINDELDKVETGKSLTCKVDVFPTSRFPKWATTLASILCKNPDLANLTNEKLAALIENDDGETGLDHTTLSRKLSAEQHLLVCEILRDHGYSVDTLRKGTDIKKIIKNNVRTASLNDSATKFYHDSIEIDGRIYKYKLRRNANGNRLLDFSIRMCGCDVPLVVVLKLRGVNANEFTTKDELACEFAAQEHTVIQSASNDNLKPLSLEKLIDYTNNRERDVDPNNYTGTQLFEVMRTWYFGFSPARQKMATFHDFFVEMKSNPTFVDAVRKFVNKTDESKEKNDEAIVKTSVPKGDYICDTNGNLIEISSLKHRTSHITNHESTSLEFADDTATAAPEECLSH